MRRGQAWLLAICAVLTNLVNFLDRQTLSVLAPQVRHGLGIGQSGYGWIQAAFACSYLIASPLAGRLLDRVGARRGLLAAVLLWSAVSALHSIAPTFGFLLVLRIGLGVAESPCLPGGTQVVVRALPIADRSRGLGLLFVGSSIGAAIAAPLATHLAKAWTWQTAFLGTAAAGLLWVPLWIAVAWRPSARAAIDAPPPTAERRPAGRFFETLLHPVIFRGVLVVLLVSPAVVFSSVWSAELLTTDHGLVPSAVGHYLWLPPLGVDVGALLFGDLHGRRAHRRHGASDRLLFAIAIACITGGAWFAAFAPDAWTTVAGTGTMMCGAAGIYTLMLAETTPHAPGAVALIGGLVTGAQSVAAIAVNPVIGAIAQHTHTYRGVLLAIGALALVAAALWLVRGTDRSRPA